MKMAQITKSTAGILLFTYGMMGALFQTFIGYWTYLNMDQQIMRFLILILNPLILVIPLSTSNILIIGIYPFASMICGFFLVIFSKKKKKRRI